MKKENRNRISFSVRKEYQHVYEFLDKQPNVSDYICRLIQKEMEKELKQSKFEEKVDQLLWAISNQQGIFRNQPMLSNKAQNEDQLGRDDIELINELF